MEGLKIFIICFNFGKAGSAINGPAMSLIRFKSIMESHGVKVSVASFLKSERENCIDLKNLKKCYKEVSDADIVHHWSGDSEIFSTILGMADYLGKKIVVGPNVIDDTNISKSNKIIKRFRDAKLLSPSDYHSMEMSCLYKTHFNTLKIGPDFKKWTFGEKENFILWKGNSKHAVKDVAMGLEIQKKLNKYKFVFIGYPNTYNYFSHIDIAKKAYLYIGTSISETKCNTLLEQWACGTPSVTNPGMKEQGIHMKTGIVCNKDIDSYCKSIEMLMESPDLIKEMQLNASSYVRDKYSEENTINDYKNIIGDIL